MLARSPHKTAEDLGLHQWYYDGLLRVLEAFKNNEFTWTVYSKSPDVVKVKNGFNMGLLWANDPECGTVGCISGWARYYAGKEAGNKGQVVTQYSTDSEEASRGLQSLTTPPDWQNGLYTLKQAQAALESYLLTGTAYWPDA